MINNPVIESILLEIPRVPKSSNQTMRMHWTVRRKYNKEWITEVFVALKAKGLGMPEVREKVKRAVTITQYRKRRLDKDNLYGSCKPVIDALRYNNLIWQDSPQWIELNVFQHTDKYVRMMIVVEDDYDT